MLLRGEVLPGVLGDAATTLPPATLRDAGLLIEGDRIAEIGAFADLRSRYPHAPTIGGAGMLLLPGLVDAHDHGRGLTHVQHGILDDGLEIWVLRLAESLPIDPYLTTLWSGLKLLESGVTCVMHDFIPTFTRPLAEDAEGALRAYAELGMRAGLGVPFCDQPIPGADDPAFLATLPPSSRDGWLSRLPWHAPASYFEAMAELAHRCRERYPLVHLHVSPAGPWACSDRMLEELTAWARAHGLRRHLHLLESRYQRALGPRRYGGRTLVEALASMGLLGPDLTCAHGVWLAERDIALLAMHRVAVAHNPSSNLRLRSGIAPLAALLGAGVTVGLGLDGISLDDDEDFLREMRLCYTLATPPGYTAPRVAAEQILRLATSGGGRAVLGDGEPLRGLLAPGAPADVAVLDAARMREPFVHPRLPTIELVLRRGAARDVRAVIVAGQPVLRDGGHVRIDRRALVARIAEAAERSLRDAPDPPTWREPALAALRAYYAGWEEPPIVPWMTHNART